MLGTLGWRLVRAAVGAVAVRGLVRLVLGQLDSAPRTSRRDFLRWTVGGAGTFFLAEAAAGFVAFFWPTKIDKFGTKIAVPEAGIPAAGAAPIANRDGKFWLINNEDGALALYWKCVHLGCTVPWNEDEKQFHCPCHSSLYDRRGVVVGGPAPRPLDIMQVEVTDEGVVVDSGKITQRRRYTPDQAVKLPG
ncbi:MAG: Rieske 2Fe-2S domain-containing protein [Chloroflexota bacterium]|nr:Rieske 2Fe-2S domain-containing protein [Chloroflexota bacterium]